MKLESVYDTLDSAVFKNQARHLTKVEALILEGALCNKTYDDISRQSPYSLNYLKRDVGPKLWRLLSSVFKTNISKKNFREVVLEHNLIDHYPIIPEVQELRTAYEAPSLRVDWGDAVDLAEFYGRTEDIEKLKHWILGDKSNACRMAMVLGIGGVGKTALSVKVAKDKDVQSEFDFVIWRSLVTSQSESPIAAPDSESPKAAPSLDGLLTDILGVFPDSDSTKNEITSLLQKFVRYRCLLIIDGIEQVLQAGKRAGRYQDGYKHYGDLIRRVGEENHQSCLMLVGREKPDNIALMEGKFVRSLTVNGLERKDAEEIIKVKGFSLDQHRSDWTTLINHYQGHPLAIKLAATTIYDLFNGDVQLFLKQNRLLFNRIYEMIDEQIKRTSEIEELLLKEIARRGGAVPLTALEDLKNAIQPLKDQVKYIGALMSLKNRSLIDVDDHKFTLHALVKAYILEKFISGKDAQSNLKQFNIENDLLETSYRSDLADSNSKDIFIENSSKPSEAPILESEIKDFHDGMGDVLSGAYSHQQKFFAIGDAEGRIHVWQVSGNRFSHYKSWQAHQSWVRTVAFSPDDTLLVSGSNDRTIKFWNFHTGELLYTHSTKEWIRSIAFHPNKQRLVTGSDAHIMLYDLAIRAGKPTILGQKLLNINAHYDHRVRSVAFSSDGQYFATGSDDCRVILWDAKTDTSLEIFEGHENRIRCVAFSPSRTEPYLASSSDDGTIQIWNYKTNELIAMSTGHKDRIRSIAFSPDGKFLASGNDDRTIMVWEVKPGELSLYATFGDRSDHCAGRINSVVFSPDGRYLVSGGDRQTLKVWDLETQRCVKHIEGITHGIRSLMFYDDETLISGNDDHTIKMWKVLDNQTQECIKTLAGHNGRIHSLARHGSMLASGSDDCTFKLWDLDAGQCTQTTTPASHWVRSVAFNSNGNWLAVAGDDGIVQLWPLQNGVVASDRKPKIQEGKHAHWVRSIAFSPNNKYLASAGDDQVIYFWNLDAKQSWKAEKHEHRIQSISFSPDSKILASGSDDTTIRLWHAHNGKSCMEPLIIPDSKAGVKSIAFSPKSSHLLASGGEDGVVRLWNLKTRKCRDLGQHNSGILAIAFSPNGRSIASSSRNGEICIWKI